VGDALAASHFFPVPAVDHFSRIAASDGWPVQRTYGEGGKVEMQGLVEQTKEALLKAVERLTTDFRIHIWDFLPYEATALVLCYVYAHSKTPTADQVKRVRQWFWRSASS
jgi:hypothetical protein